MKLNIKNMGTLLIASALLLSGADTTASAANFNGKKYYINPGHGGHDSNDRPTPLPLSVTIFYESDGNLSRGLFLRDFIKSYGGAVKMSRTTNTSADDLGLTTIATQSNSYGGYFMSLHTNGANASANYIVSFFRSSSSAKTTPVVSGSNTMAKAVADWHNNNHLTNFTYSTQRALGDYSFYGYNLGVLRTNSRPGYLVETVFHDYRPDGLRLKSDIYNRYTAWQILMAARQNSGGSAGMTANVKGCIIGDIRDLSQSNGYTSYTARGRDQYLAVNSATVRLLNSSGTQVATMTTDKCANGLYGFFELTAGTYTIEVSKSGYKTQTKTVTVANNASTKQLFNLVQGTDSGITVSPTNAEFSQVTLNGSQTVESKTITVTRTGFTSDITITSSDATIFPVSKTKITSNSETFNISYNPTSPGSHKATITLSGGGFTKKIIASGTAVNPPLVLTNGYTYGEVKGTQPDWLPEGGWGKLRNMCFGDGKLYIVNATDGIIYIVNARTCDLIGTLDMTGVDGGTYKVMDVKYLNGKIIACNLAINVDGQDDAPLKVYVWESDDAKPTCILNTYERSGVSRLGDTFDIEGNLVTGKLSFAYGGTDGDDSRVFTYAITNGTVATTPESMVTQLDDGTVINLGLSARAVSNGDGTYWVMGQNNQPTLIGSDGKATTSMNVESLDNVIRGNDFEQFTFKGTPYVAATTYAPKDGTTVTEELKLGGAALIDATNGANDGTLLKKYPKAGLGTTRNTTFSTSVEVDVNGDEGVEMWVLIAYQGLGYYKYGTGRDFSTKTPTLSATTDGLNFGDIVINNSATRNITVSGANLVDNISLSVTGDGFSVSPASFTKDSAGGTATITFAPTKTGSVTGSLTISSTGAESLTYTLTGQAVTNDAPTGTGSIESLTEVWNVSTAAANTDGSFFDPKNSGVRSLAVNGDDLYVCAGTLYAPKILIVNSKTGKDTGRTVNVEGISGGIWYLSHLEMLGSHLYASNVGRGFIQATTDTDKDQAMLPLKIYRWNDVTSAPEVVVSYDVPDGWARLGETLSVWGDENNGRLMVYYLDNLLVFTVNNGTVSQTPTIITLSKSLGGGNSTTGVVYNGNNTYTIFSKDALPTCIDTSGNVVETLPSTAITNKYGTDAKVFNYGAHRYMAATAYKTGDLTGGVLDVIDITDGLSKASLKFSQPKADDGLGATKNGQYVTDVDVQLSDEGKTLRLWVLVPFQGAAMYTYSTVTPEEPTIVSDRSHHAYNLKGANSQEYADLSFDLTGDVKNVRIELYMRADASTTAKALSTGTSGTPTFSYDMGSLKAGSHTYRLNYSGVTRATYDWVVVVENYPVQTSAKVYNHAPTTLSVKGGVAVVTDPESAAYGKIVTSNGCAQGFNVYSPTHTLEGTYLANTATWTASNKSSLLRIASRDNGLMYAINYADAGAGIWTFDPANPTTASTNIFSGTKDDGGCWTYNGVALGGGGTGLCFTGTGASTALWSFQEDYPAGNNDVMYLCRYDIGTDQKITKAPVKFDNISSDVKFHNKNVNLVADGNKGLFVAQVRGNGNNTGWAPGFVYIDLNGNILYNSSDHSDIIPSCGSGLALSSDRKLLAVSGGKNPIRLFDVTWASDGTPTLTYREEITGSENTMDEVPQLAFDVANNLVAYQQSADANYNGLNIYSVPGQYVVSTPARTAYYIDATTTGVENVAVDADDANPVYYDLRGVRMPDGEKLAPGAYIKVTGNQAEKVIIR